MSDLPLYYEYEHTPDAQPLGVVRRSTAEFVKYPLRKKIAAGIFSVICLIAFTKEGKDINNAIQDFRRSDDSEYRSPNTPIERTLTAIGIDMTGNNDLRVGCGDPNAFTTIPADGVYLTDRATTSHQETIVIKQEFCDSLETPHFTMTTDGSGWDSAKALATISHEYGHGIVGLNESKANCAGKEIATKVAEQLTGVVPASLYQEIYIDTIFRNTGNESYHQIAC